MVVCSYCKECECFVIIFHFGGHGLKATCMLQYIHAGCTNLHIYSGLTVAYTEANTLSRDVRALALSV